MDRRRCFCLYRTYVRMMSTDLDMDCNTVLVLLCLNTLKNEYVNITNFTEQYAGRDWTVTAIGNFKSPVIVDIK